MQHPSLPERLRYLQPFRKKFASRPPEDLNEDSGAAVLMPLLSKRLRGLSPAEAGQVLSEDFAALQQWLSDSAQQNDPLQFVRGFMLVTSPQDLAKHIKEEEERPPEPLLCVHIELPSGAKLRRVDGAKEDCKIVVLKGLWLVLEAFPQQTVSNLYDETQRIAGSAKRSEVAVSIGPVIGRKLIVEHESWLGRTKDVTYALDVPGGHVFGSISPVGKKVDQLNWDESPFESCFQTLCVESKTPASG